MGLRTVKGMKEIEKEQRVAEAKSKSGVFLIIGPGESRRLHFLTEPEQGVGFYEHVFRDPESGNWQFLACQDPCPLCNSDDEQLSKTSYRVAYVVMPEDEKKAYILKANTDLNGRIITRFDSRETLTDRPYIVSRTGKGIDTSWDIDPVDTKSNLPDDVLERLAVGDPIEFIEGVLQKRIDVYFGDGDQPSAPEETAPVVWDNEPAQGGGERPAAEKKESAEGDPW